MRTIFYAFLGLMLIGCSDNYTVYDTKIPIDICDELAVINQILPQLNDSSPLCDYRTSIGKTGDSLDLVYFKERYNETEIKLIYEEFDTSKLIKHDLRFSSIRVVCLPDSIYSNGSLQALPLSTSMINHPFNTVLVNENHKLNAIGRDKSTFSFTRVLIEKNKASFKYFTTSGPMSKRGYNVTCVKKNGAWVVVKHDLFLIA